MNLNFVQTPTAPKIEPAEHRAAISIAPNVLFWFRYAALATVVLGLILSWQKGYIVQALTFQKPLYTIGIGMWFALTMAFKVWFIIWPNQQKRSARSRPPPMRNRGRTSCRHDLAHQHHALDLDAVPHGATERRSLAHVPEKAGTGFPIRTCASSTSRSTCDAALRYLSTGEPVFGPGRASKRPNC